MTTTNPTPLTPEISVIPLRHGVSSAGGAHEVMVRIRAPERRGVAPKRTPLRLALVIDRSGSMDGAPLQEAKRCVEHIVTRLQPVDSVAVLAYDNAIQVPVPLQPAHSHQAILAAIREIESGGSTDLFSGWEEGAKQLEGGHAQAISRVILLSDGQANHGLVDAQQIFKHCASWLAKGITTSTVGLGRGFNEDLMVGMASASGGQHYYGKSAQDLYDGFDEELSLLNSLFLRRLRVKPVTAPGVIAEPLGLIKPDANGWVPLSDLAWGSEAFLMLRLHVAAQAGGTLASLLAVNLEAQSDEGQSIVLSIPPLAVPVLSPQDWQALHIDATVASRLSEAEFAELSDRARRLVRQRQVEEARALLAQARERFKDQPWIVGKLERLEALLEQDTVLASKEMLYSAMKMSRRLAAASEASFCADEMESTEMPAFLRRKLEEGRGRRRS
ncbi:MAG: VWA domain-containing protein [Proteobacteria bacterium]|nr:VWA domain-containing protein [Pseudomonadota bacterium]